MIPRSQNIYSRHRNIQNKHNIIYCKNKKQKQTKIETKHQQQQETSKEKKKENQVNTKICRLSCKPGNSIIHFVLSAFNISSSNHSNNMKTIRGQCFTLIDYNTWEINPKFVKHLVISS